MDPREYQLALNMVCHVRLCTYMIGCSVETYIGEQDLDRYKPLDARWQYVRDGSLKKQAISK